MRRIRMGLLPGLLLALALALVVGACGGGGGNNSGVASLGGAGATSTTTTTGGGGGGGGDSRQRALAYARCMRQNGIDMPDPTFDAQGHMAQQLPAGVGPDDPKFKAADQACKQYAPSGEPEKPDPQLQQQMVAYARCMRQHGINIPDPKPGGGIDANGEAGVNPNSPAFKAADQACQRYVPRVGDRQQQQSQPSGGGGG